MSIAATLIASPQLAALQAAASVVVIDTRDADTFADALSKASQSGHVGRNTDPVNPDSRRRTGHT